MTRDEIIRLAREAGFWVDSNGIINGGDNAAGLLDFAVLVAEAEREACAKLCEEIKCGMWEGSKKHRDTRLRDASDGAGTCTYAIRARGESK